MAIPPTPNDTWLAILIGASEWPELGIAAGESYSKSFWDFKDYLRHPHGLVLPEAHIHTNFDSVSSSTEILNDMTIFLRKHTKQEKPSNILIYLIGQGQLWEKEFYFAVRSSQKNRNDTFLSASDMAKLLVEEARTCRHFMIVDACHSGAASNSNWKSPKGACLLCSAGAHCLSQSTSKDNRTQFTGAMLEVLQGSDNSGVFNSNEPMRLSFDQLHSRIKNRLKADYKENAVIPDVRDLCGPGLEGYELLPIVKNSERQLPSEINPGCSRTYKWDGTFWRILFIVGLVFLGIVVSVSYFATRPSVTVASPTMQSKATDSVNNSQIVVEKPMLEIVTPQEGQEAEYVKDTDGSGGRVEIKGRVQGLPGDVTISLEVEVYFDPKAAQLKVEGIYPQPKVLKPNIINGEWSGFVQVGNSTWPPEPGQNFKVIATARSGKTAESPSVVRPFKLGQEKTTKRTQP